MYGLVNAAVQELVTTRFGAHKWEEIKARAAIKTEGFAHMEAYPDESTYRLVAAASEVLGITQDEVMKAFGAFWIEFASGGAYGHLFQISNDSLQDFLFNLDNLHTRVGQSFPKLRPPSFRFDVIDDETLRMHYLSERPGLCPLVLGLLHGLAARFDTELEVEHTDDTCSRKGADHCEFTLYLQQRD